MNGRKIAAVVLAAGRGERLRPLTASVPKCLVPVGGDAILGWTINHLQRVGIRSIIIVTGYRAAKIRKFIKNRSQNIRFRIRTNPIYGRTNTLYSLWVCRKALADKPFLLLDGDLVYAPEILATLLRSKKGNVLACDGSRELDEEAVCASGTLQGRIVQIGKRISPYGKVFGESIGMARIDARTSRQLFQMAGKLLTNGGSRLYYETAFQKLIDQGIPFWAKNIDGARWTEIDTKSDLRRARGFFKKSATRA